MMPRGVTFRCVIVECNDFAVSLLSVMCPTNAVRKKCVKTFYTNISDLSFSYIHIFYHALFK